MIKHQPPPTDPRALVYHNHRSCFREMTDKIFGEKEQITGRLSMGSGIVRSTGNPVDPKILRAHIKKQKMMGVTPIIGDSKYIGTLDNLRKYPMRFVG